MKNLKILHILIGLILLTPLIIVKSPPQFYIGKAVYLQVIIILIVLFYFLLVKKNKSYLPKLNVLTLLVLAYFGIYAISAFLSPGFHRSIWGNYDRGSLGLANLAFFTTLFLITASVFKSDGQWRNFFKFSLFISVITALFALIFVNDTFIGTRLFGTLGNPALLAGYLLPHAFLALWFFAQEQKRKIKSPYLGAYILLSVTIFLTAVRGALLGLFVGTVLFLFLLVSREKTLRKYAVLILVLLVIFPVALFSFKNTDFVRSNFYLSKITDTNFNLGASIGNRLAVWQMAIEGFKQKPLLGWGPENFVLVYYNNFNPEMFINSFKENIFDHAHSVPLDILSTVGILGLAAYLAVWFLIFYKLKQKNNLLLVPLFIAVFIHNLFIFDSLSSYLIFFLLLGFLAKDENAVARTRAPAFLFFLIFILLAVLSFSFMKKAGQEFFVKQSASFVLSDAELLDDAGQEFKDRLVSEISRVESMVESDSKNPIWQVYWGALSNEAGRLISKDYYVQSENLIEKAASEFPPHQQLYYQLARSQAGQGKFNQAVETADFTISLNPKADESYWRKALLYIDFGDFETGYKLVQEAEEAGYLWFFSFNDTMKLIDIEIRRGNYERVAFLYEVHAIGRFRPESAQLHASLAATYAKLGEKEKAIEYASKAAELDKSFKKEAESFIKSLDD